MQKLSLCLALLFCYFNLPKLAWAAQPPPCRFDDENSKTVEIVLHSVKKASAELDQKLPFEKIAINPESATSSGTLEVYIVSDATINAVDKSGCIVRQPAITNTEELDNISVRGGCVAISGEVPQIQCSSNAIKTFGYAASDRLNPALLYVLAHELAHILQRRTGEYAGRVEAINLKALPEANLELLRESCEPGLNKVEEAADHFAVQILAKLLPRTPYRETTFSDQGSVLWGIDQLNLAAQTWRKDSLEREFISVKPPHRSFVPTEFPTSDLDVNLNAERFVCDVLTKESGEILYPGRASTHPTLEVRMQRVAEELRPIAMALPKTGAQQEYKPVAILQEQLGDIFTFMYRETGVYLESLQTAICTRVNSDNPVEGCTEHRQ